MHKVQELTAQAAKLYEDGDANLREMWGAYKAMTRENPAAIGEVFDREAYALFLRIERAAERVRESAVGMRKLIAEQMMGDGRTERQ